MVVLYGLKVNQ